MSYIIDLILENITLEIITGGVSTANVMISSGKLENITLEIITGGVKQLTLWYQWQVLTQMSMYTSLWRYISLFVSNSVKYGAGNYNGS